jgi:prenyltransferase beta subunit
MVQGSFLQVLQQLSQQFDVFIDALIAATLCHLFLLLPQRILQWLLQEFRMDHVVHDGIYGLAAHVEVHAGALFFILVILAHVGHEFGAIVDKIGDVGGLRFVGFLHVFNEGSEV